MHCWECPYTSKVQRKYGVILMFLQELVLIVIMMLFMVMQQMIMSLSIALIVE